MKAGLEACLTLLFGMACPLQVGTRTSVGFLSVFGTQRKTPALLKTEQLGSEAKELRKVTSCQQILHNTIGFIISLDYINNFLKNLNMHNLIENKRSYL